MENKEITPEIVQYQPTTPATLLSLAVDQGADLEKLEQLMALQTKWEINEARKAYMKAMAAFKTEPLDIYKDAKVSYQTGKGQTSYSHATLGNITRIISAALSKHGLTASWDTKQEKDQITVTCKITHELGHSESTSLLAASDTSGGKNSIQAIASTVSYLSRYTLHAITGTAAMDMDNDGKGAGPEMIGEGQLNEIDAMLSENGLKENKKYMANLLTWLQVKSLSDIPQSKAKMTINAIKTAIKGGSNGNN